MSSFCKNTPQSLSDSDLSTLYGTATSPGLLPADGFNSNARDGNGVLTSEALSGYLTTLNNLNAIPQVPKVLNNPSLTTYLQQDATFLQNIQAEYCFYDVRYRYALTQLVNNLASGYSNGATNSSSTTSSSTTSSSTTSTTTNYLQYSQSLNQKLNDLTQIISEISKTRYKFTGNTLSNLSSINAEITKNNKKLKKQAEILNSNTGSADLYKEMVSYTQQKARRTNNLMNSYAFLNIVMLSLMLYIYRSLPS